jgi:hypothetical protein
VSTGTVTFRNFVFTLVAVTVDEITTNAFPFASDDVAELADFTVTVKPRP